MADDVDEAGLQYVVGGPSCRWTLVSVLLTTAAVIFDQPARQVRC